MNVIIDNISETRKKINVSIPANEITEEEKTLLKDLSPRVQVPGFRPGKAPAHLIKKSLGNRLDSELKRKITAKAYTKSLDETKLEVYSILEVEDSKVTSKQGGEITFTVDINPDFELPEYLGIEIEAPSTEIKDEEVDNSIEALRNERAKFEVVDRAVENGDYVKLSYTGKIEDKLISEILPDHKIYGSQENTWEEAGNDQNGISAIVDGITGMKSGDKKSVEMIFDTELDVKELAGKKVHYDIEIHEVREKELPELDEKFLKELGVESIEQLKNQLFEYIQTQKDRNKNISLRDQIVNELDKRVSEFPLPESAIEEERELNIQQLMNSNLKRGVPNDELEKHKVELYDKSHEIAKKNIRNRIILFRIAKKTTMEVKDEDVSNYIMAKANATKTKPEEIVKELKNDRAQLQKVQLSILLEKTLQFLLKEANVKNASTEDKKEDS